jgi:CRP/FNR family cyclic AMP-dependent transcriptional regulator
MFAKVPLFAGLTAEQIDFIAAGAKIQNFPRGAVIITQGDLSDSLFVLLSGRLKVYIAGDNGREILLDFIEPDDTFGELSLLDGHPRSATVIAVESVRLARLPKEHFLYCLEKYPAAALALLKNLAERSRGLVSKVSNLGLLDVYGRVVNVLMACADKDDNGCYVTKPITHQELANSVGASREMITRILNDLKKGGYISIQKQQITMRHQLPNRW